MLNITMDDIRKLNEISEFLPFPFPSVIRRRRWEMFVFAPFLTSDAAAYLSTGSFSVVIVLLNSICYSLLSSFLPSPGAGPVPKVAILSGPPMAHIHTD